MAALGDENIGGLDVAMNDAGFVCGIEGVGDFDGKSESGVEIERSARRCGASACGHREIPWR